MKVISSEKAIILRVAAVEDNFYEKIGTAKGSFELKASSLKNEIESSF